MALVLKHQTKEQFIARFREKYANSSKEQCAKLATWLMDKMDAGEFTDSQLRDSFKFTVVQWVDFRNELNNFRSSWRNIQNARGR